MKIKKTYLLPTLLFTCIIFSFTAAAQESFQGIWEEKLKFYDKDYTSVTSIHPSNDGSKVAVINPMGIEVFQSSKGKLLNESASKEKERSSNKFKPSFGPSKSKGITIGGGKKKDDLSLADELNALQKIVHLPIPQQNAVLRFDYDLSREVISLIDLETGKEMWRNDELKWSMDDVKVLMNALASVSPGSDAAMVARLGAELLQYPRYYIEKLVTFVPQHNVILIDAFFGLACLDLATGNIKWTVEETIKGLSHIIYDEPSNSIVTFGGNPAWLPTLLGLETAFQLSKDMLRIDLGTGEILWKSRYEKNYRVKKDGGFDSEAIKPDIRLYNDRIITNFNQIEIFDFKTGSPLMSTSTGMDAPMGFMGYGPASEFALPLIEGDMLYRSVITKVLAFGASAGGEQPQNYNAILEAYSITSGELLWTSEEFSRQKINNIGLYGGLLLLSFDGKEGVQALNPQSGEKIWTFETGKKGITAKWLSTDNKLAVVENKVVHILNLENGKIMHTIDVEKVTDKISEIRMYKNKLLVIGKKKGLALYNIDQGTLSAEVKTGYKLKLREYPNKFVAHPTDPSDPLMILDVNDLIVLGILNKSGNRTAISWCESTENVYELRGKEVSAYHFTGVKN